MGLPLRERLWGLGEDSVFAVRKRCYGTGDRSEDVVVLRCEELWENLWKSVLRDGKSEGDFKRLFWNMENGRWERAFEGLLWN